MMAGAERSMINTVNSVLEEAVSPAVTTGFLFFFIGIVLIIAYIILKFKKISFSS